MPHTFEGLCARAFDSDAHALAAKLVLYSLAAVMAWEGGFIAWKKAQPKKQKAFPGFYAIMLAKVGKGRIHACQDVHDYITWYSKIVDRMNSEGADDYTHLDLATDGLDVDRFDLEKAIKDVAEWLRRNNLSDKDYLRKELTGEAHPCVSPPPPLPTPLSHQTHPRPAGRTTASAAPTAAAINTTTNTTTLSSPPQAPAVVHI